jgi:integrase
MVINPTNGTTIPKCSYSEKKVLTEEQIETFLGALPSYPEWRDFFYTEIMTGMRRGEICGLKWSDFEPYTGKLHIQRSVSSRNGIAVGETKTKTGNRYILLPPSVTSLLIERKKDALSEWIFYHYSDPASPMSPDVAYRALKQILKNEGLPDIRFHDLRHSFATNALRVGIDPKTLSAILGHTNSSFTLNTYTQVTTDMQHNAADAISAMFDKIKVKDK